MKLNVGVPDNQTRLHFHLQNNQISSNDHVSINYSLLADKGEAMGFSNNTNIICKLDGVGPVDNRPSTD